MNFIMVINFKMPPLTLFVQSRKLKKNENKLVCVCGGGGGGGGKSGDLEKNPKSL